MRRKTQDHVQVEVHRGHQILLNKATSKFEIGELAEVEPLDSVQKAKNAIDRHLNNMNKGVRRKIIFLSGRYYSDDEPRQICEGELTSWTRPRGYAGRIEGVVVTGRNDRSNMSPGDIFEDTPENRALLEQVIEQDRVEIAAKKKAEEILEQVKRAELPAHLKEQ